MNKCWFYLIAFFLCSLTARAQATVDDLKPDSARMFVAYLDYSGYVNDSVFISMKRTSLFLGKKAAIYIYKTATEEEFWVDFKKSLRIKEGKTVDTNSLMASFKKSFDIEKNLSVVFAKYYDSPDYLNIRRFTDGDVWLSDTARYRWSPANEFKDINGYRCQKAIYTTAEGAEVSAWFTEEIPFAVGPLYISGLPGLILEYHNPATKRFFRSATITSTDIPEQHFRSWLTGPIVSKSEYRVMYDNNSSKLGRMMKMLEMQKD